MSKQTINRFKKLLFEYADNTSLKTYAIADSVREEKLKEKLLLSGLDYRELWQDEIVEDTFEVPLYLIKLKKDNELTTWLISNHDKNIVTYFQSPYSIDELHYYYSPLTLPEIGVNDGGYERAIFGFFDPLVLSIYIDTLYTSEKRKEFFSAGVVWFSPIAEKADTCYYAFIKEGNNEVEKNKLDLSNDREWLNHKAIKIPDSEILINNIIPVIDHEQIKLFKEAERKTFCLKVLNLLGEKETDKNISTAIKAFDFSKKLGVNSEANELRVIQIALNLPNPITSYDEQFKLVKQAETEFEKAERLDVILVTMQLEEKIENE